MLLFTRVFTKKMKNKCLQLFLVLLCLISVFGLAKEVKAEITLNTKHFFNTTNSSINGDQPALHWWGYVNNTATCDDTILIVFPSDCDRNGTIEYNGDALTPVWGNAMDCAYYLLNPDEGNYSLDFWESAWGAKTWMAGIYCGVDQTEPILNKSSNAGATHTYYWDYMDFVISDTIEGEYFVADFVITPPTEIEPLVKEGTSYFTNDRYQSLYSQVATTTSMTITTYGQSNWFTWYIWLTLNPAISNFCGDSICNGEENTLTCSEDCPPSNGYSNIITLLYNPTEHPLIPDALDAFYFSYNTSLISNTYFGGLAYIEIERCLNVGCSTTTPYFFTDYTGATSTKSYILSKTITIASSTNTVGRSLFTIANESWRISSSTREVYKIIPTYYNIGTSEMTTGNPTAQAINWVAYDEQPPLPECVDKVFDGSTVCDIYDLEALTGQILCGFTYGTGQTLFWLFNPSCSSLDYIISGYNNFKGAFPFNAYYDLVDALDVAINSVATSSTSTIGVPFIDKDATSSNKFYILPVISSSSINNAIGTENANVFRTTIGYLIWIIVAWIVYLIISKL